MTEDWIVRLRSKLATTVCVPPKRVKPVEADLPIASASCPHPAGSFEKIEVMRQRAANGRSIFHPGDNREIQYKAG
jgi:hypothetical protein